jgi:hypothetical protein
VNAVKKKRETSKMLVVINTVFFFGVVIFCMVSWLLYRAMPTELLIYVSAPYVTVNASYFGMAAYVNRQKVQTYGGQNQLETYTPSQTPYNPYSKGGGY